MNRRLYFVAIALLVGTLCSCERENYPTNFKNDGNVGVIVSDAGRLMTKSAASKEELIGSTLLEDIDGQDFRLDAYVEDNDIMPFAQEVGTKGSIVDDSANYGININSNGQTFTFNGWLGGENNNRYPNDVDNGRTYEDGGSTGRVNDVNDATDFHFLKNSTAKYDGSWSLDKTTKWRNGVPTSFWSYYPVGISKVSLPAINAVDADQSKVKFEYSTPATAAAQQDILFAYNLHTVTYDDKGGTNDSELVSINFYHALAAIRFDVSDAITKDVQITNVFFENVVTDAECAIVGTAGTNNTPGTVSFTWTPTEGEDKATVSQNVVASDFTDGLMPLTSEKFFFLIPQDVKGLVKVGIVFTRTDGVSYTRKFDLSHDAAWEAGKIYTYKLKPASDLIDVEVIETVDATVGTKTDVKVSNTGSLDEFVRVAIAGNWYVTNASGEKVLTNAWTFNKADFVNFNDTDWTLKSDGLLYSNEKLEPGDTVKLFDKFTAGTAPVAGATLELYIIAQSVVAGKADGWDAAVAATNN